MNDRTTAPASRPARHRHHHRLPAMASVLGLALLAACGGGGSSGEVASSAPASPSPSPTPGITASATNTFPVGLAIASPGDVGGTTLLASAPTGLERALGLGRSLWQALAEGDRAQVARLAWRSLPIGSAHAAGAGTPAVLASADLLKDVLDGTGSVALATHLNLQHLFGGANRDASCYGPQVAYATHEDDAGAPSGLLPSGDVGMWRETEADGTPCVVAQLNKRVESSKRQGLQGLLMAAVMRRTVVADGLAMPAAGASVDLAAPLQARLAAALPGSPMTVVAATIARDATGGLYTYRLVLTNGGTGSAAKRGEMVLRHQPGSAATEYTGVLQVAGFFLDSTDPAFVCSDRKDASGNYQTATVSSLKYARSGGKVSFASRQSRYCGAPSGTTSHDAAAVASFTADGELDIAARISPNTSYAPAGTSRGWRGDFSRYAGDFDTATGAGNFLLAWQAGPQDSHARTLAATASLGIDDARTVRGYYAYAADIGTTGAAFAPLGMICNWAGPGHRHLPIARFQSQTARQPAGGGAFAIPSPSSSNSRIAYAPTNSCTSTTTQFDVDAGALPATGLTAGEGVGTTASLDGLTGTNATVDAEIRSRGWARPSLF